MELWASPLPKTPTKKADREGRYVAVFLSAVKQQEQEQMVLEPASLRVLRLPPSSSSSSHSSSSFATLNRRHHHRRKKRTARGIFPDLSQLWRWLTRGDDSIPHEKEECLSTEAVHSPGTEELNSGERATAAPNESVESTEDAIRESDWRKSKEVWRLDVWPKDTGTKDDEESHGKIYEWPPALKPWLPL
jgi:hypothetical protein